MSRMVMGYWDCPVCGNKGIAGNVMNCPACGRARGDVKFYMKGVAENAVLEADQTGNVEYLSEEQAKDFDAEADWYCSFCNSLNKNRAAFCSNCGATREQSESNYFDQLKKRQEQEAAEAAAQNASAPRAKAGRNRIWLWLVLIALVVGVFTYTNGNTTKGDLLVTDISWSREIPVEDYREYQEEGWAIPQGGAQISKSTKLHHYDQVLDHYEDVEVQRSRQVLDGYETYYTYTDRGNGSFEQVEHSRPVYKTEYYTETESRPVYRSVPRYATWYVYSIWRWKYARTATASGTDHETAWPDTALQENERESTPRTEEYSFTVESEKDGRSTWTLAEADWRNINPGDKLNITTKRTGADPWITDSDGNQVAQIRRK